MRIRGDWKGSESYGFWFIDLMGFVSGLLFPLVGLIGVAMGDWCTATATGLPRAGGWCKSMWCVGVRAGSKRGTRRDRQPSEKKRIEEEYLQGCAGWWRSEERRVGKE